MVVAIGVAEFYGLHVLLAPAGLIILGTYGWTFPFNGPEDITHRFFSSLAIAGGLFEGWRRWVSPNDKIIISKFVLLIAAAFLLFHRHSHHQTTFVTIHHTIFATTLMALAAGYSKDNVRSIIVVVAGLILSLYFID
jgi:hypothetical protein